MSFNFFVEPAVVGLSMGAYCLSYCFPFLATFLTSENRRIKKNLVLILYFTFGRFLGYMVFGLIFSYLGQKLQYPYLNLITDLSLIFISIVLLLHIAGLFKQKENACLFQKFQNRNAAVMGFLMGVNICPPFLLSIAYVFSLHNTLEGLLYFIIFFFVSSVYFLPMVFVGMLAKMKELQKIARFSGIMAACIFILYGSYSIVSHFLIKH